MAMVVKGKHAYAPNPHKEGEPFEDGLIMGIHPELTHAMIDFEDGSDPVIVAIDSLEPVCDNCGGMTTAECCDASQQ